MSSHESESILVTRVLIGSPERVFDAWINPALLQKWLAPKAEVDARDGGQFRLEVAKPEGVHVVTGKYEEFKPNERLVMTWVYDGPMGSADKMEALLTVDFALNLDLTVCALGWIFVSQLVCARSAINGPSRTSIIRSRLRTDLIGELTSDG